MNPRAPNNETLRQLAQIIVEGVIDHVDLDTGKARVRIGETVSPALDWFMPVGDTTIWMPPSAGAACVVLCPEADIERGVILNGLTSSVFAALFKGKTNAVRFADGAMLSYAPETSVLDFALPGSLTISAPSGIRIEGDIELTGNLKSTGTIKADQDVLANGTSLKGHVHTGVTAGSAVSGAPKT